MPKNILLITEKRDQAEKLAAAIDLKKGNNCWKGKLHNDNLTVVCAAGHLLRPLNPNEVDPDLTWNDPKMLVPIPRDYRMRPIEGDRVSNYLKNIKLHMKGKDMVVLGLDSDREGERIGWSIIKYMGWKGETKRAWFSAGLDKKSMKNAVYNLREPQVTYGYSVAAEARARSDWPYMYLVRAYTFYAKHNCFGPNLGRGNGKASATSVGRVQTPALGMIVKREEAINRFVPQNHYRLFANFIPSTGNNSILTSYAPLVTEDIINSNPPGIVWDPSKAVVKDGDPEPLDSPLFVGKNEVDAFIQRLTSAANQATVLSYSESKKKESPPKTFDLANATSEISSKLKVSDGLAQTILEDLYEQGWTSYARTSKSSLPVSLYDDEARNEMFDSLKFLDGVSEQAAFAQSIHNNQNREHKKFQPSVFEKKDMEHYGIVPTAEVMTKESFLSLQPKKKDGNSIKHTTQHMQETYLIIAKQFVQVMYPPAIYAVQDTRFTVPVVDLLGHPNSVFKTKSSRIISPGWRSAFGNNDSKDTSISPQSKGGSALLKDVELKESVTKPPSRYSEKNFQKSMANIGREITDPKYRKLLINSEGIGTPATRKDIIKTLIAREYIELKAGTYRPTKKGIDLIKSVPDWMSNPATTAMWEDYLVKIQDEQDPVKSHKMRDEFVNKQLKMVEGLIDHLNVNLFDSKGEAVARPPIKPTPKMKKLLKLVSDKKGIPIPKDALSDIGKAKEFLDTHLEKRDPNKIYPPSEAQKNFAQKIIDSGNLANDAIPDDIWTNSDAIKKFIDDNKSTVPPSQAQINFANKLISQLAEGEKAPANVLTSADACRAFIDKRLKLSKKKTPTAKKRKPKQ